ncbi:MAG: twin-arginine translocase subunit TatC [Acidobacteriota bacterium]
MALVPFPGQSTAAPAPVEDDARPPAPPGEPPSPFDEDEEPLEGRMTFLEHLDELRKRITHAVVALLVGFLVAFSFIQPVVDFVYKPMAAVVPDKKLIFTEPAEAFLIYIKIAALCGLLLASPYVMLQVWLFIAPGLYANEKKLAVPFVFFSSALFVAGAAFSHYLAFPFAWNFFAGFSNEYMSFMPRIEPVFGMYVKLALAFGVVFQLPMLVFVLARLGLVTAGFLSRNFKYAVLIIFVVAAVITPSPDPTTQILVALPMTFLYGVSILIAWLFGRKTEAPAEAVQPHP